MDPLTLALLSAGISAGGSALGGFLSRNKGDKRKNALIDDLLASLKGNGSYSDLFNMDQEAFQKSVVTPAKNIFNNQISPQIQQSYIASGQQRGTGLDDTLTRAGVNLDDMINQYYLQAQQGAQGNALSAINAILDSGNPAPQSGSSAAGQAFAGYLGSEGFGTDIRRILGNIKKDGEPQSESIFDTFIPKRKGYERDPYVYDPYTGIQR